MYSCRQHRGYYAQSIDDPVLFMNEHLTKDTPQETLFKHNDPWITSEEDTKPYILGHLDNMKLSRSQYIATSSISYGQYTENMFALEAFPHDFCIKLINIINSKTLARLNKDILIPRYNQILLDRYSDATFILRQTTKQHQKFNHTWNDISDHPNMANNTILRQKRGIISAIYNFLFGTTESQDVK